MMPLPLTLPCRADLRPWRDADLDDLVKNANDPEIASQLRDAFPHPYTEANGRDFLARARTIGNGGMLAITMDGHAIGSIGWFVQSDVHRLTAEVGYWLGRAHRGRSIMPQALRALSDLIFAETPQVRIHALPFGRNLASRRVLE